MSSISGCRDSVDLYPMVARTQGNPAIRQRSTKAYCRSFVRVPATVHFRMAGMQATLLLRPCVRGSIKSSEFQCIVPSPKACRPSAAAQTTIREWQIFWRLTCQGRAEVCKFSCPYQARLRALWVWSILPYFGKNANLCVRWLTLHAANSCF